MKTDIVYNTDCIEGIRKYIPDNSIDMIITSPPYDSLRKYKNDIDKQDFDGFSFDFYSIAKELYRVIKDGRVLVWVVGDATINGSETGNSFRQALYFKEVGFKIHDTMIYEKNAISFPEEVRYYPCFEYMFILSKGKCEIYNLIKDHNNTNSGRLLKSCLGREKNGTFRRRIVNKKVSQSSIRRNIWKYKIGKNNSTKYDAAFQHPAIFPEKLAEDHIISWSNESDIIMDCFMGSGTTAVACHRLKRKYIGFEISKMYCNLAEKRIEKEKEQLKLF